MSLYLTFKIISITIMLLILFALFIVRRTRGSHDYMPPVARAKNVSLMSKLPRILVNFLLLVSLVLVSTSCGNGGSDAKSKKVFDKIVGFKWSIDPYEGPDGSVCDILYPPGVDFHQYYAFNADGTVDYFRMGDYKTGAFSVEDNKVTCMFVETVWGDSETANDGAYNSKVVLEYKDDKLYKYDNFTRNRNDEWVSFFSKEFRTLYYSNAGHYVNEKYNVSDSYRSDYDTTANAMVVVERYNWRSETEYKNGKRNGVYKKYDNDNLAVLGRYGEGEPIGTWLFFNSSGELRIEITNIKPAPENSFGCKYVADAEETLLTGEKNNLLVYFNEDMHLYYGR